MLWTVQQNLFSALPKKRHCTDPVHAGNKIPRTRTISPLCMDLQTDYSERSQGKVRLWPIVFVRSIEYCHLHLKRSEFALSICQTAARAFQHSMVTITLSYIIGTRICNTLSVKILWVFFFFKSPPSPPPPFSPPNTQTCEKSAFKTMVFGAAKQAFADANISKFISFLPLLQLKGS